MSDFLAGSLYVDVPQTGIAVRRFQTDENFLCAVMCPRLVVKKPTGLYTVWNMADLNRDEMQTRGASDKPKVAAFGKSFANYTTDARTLAYDLNDASVASADVDSNPEVLIPRVLGYKALLHAERRMSSAFFVDTAWYRVVTGAASNSASEGTTAMNRVYFDDANTDPVDAISSEIRLQGILTGRKPTGMAFGSRLWQKIRSHPKIRATLTSGNTPIVRNRMASLDEMASLLELKWCGVSNGIFNTALEGEVATNQLIVPQDDALLFFSPTVGQQNADPGMTADNDEPSAFARLVWNGVASGDGMQIRKYRDENAGPGGSWRSVIDVYNGFQVVTRECGTRFKNMVTP